MGAITLRELVQIQRDQGQPMPWEIGVFIALEVCATLRQNSVKVSDADVMVAEDGTIGLAFSPHAVSPHDAAKGVLSILNALLVASKTQVPENLRRLSDDAATSLQLGPLQDELESCLVPLNRPASRRILSRLVRDAHAFRSGARKVDSARESVDAESVKEVDSQLDAILSDLPEVPAVSGVSGARSVGRSSEVPKSTDGGMRRAALQSVFGASEQAEHSHAHPPGSYGLGQTHGETQGGVRGPMPPPQRTEPTRESNPILQALQAGRRKTGGGPDGALEKMVELDRATAAASDVLRSSARSRQSVSDSVFPVRPVIPPGLRSGARWLALAASTAALVAAFWWLQGQRARQLARTADPSQRGAAGAQSATSASGQLGKSSDVPADSAIQSRYGDVELRVLPERAQVFLYVGSSPAIASALPEGIAHEFVAIMPGRAPRRAVVPPDARWTRVGKHSRYELAMELEEGGSRSLALGASRLPQEMGATRGEVGDVRVITNPPGASIYQLVGFGPNVEIKNLERNKSYEFLFYMTAKDPRRVLIKPEKFGKSGSRWVARLEVDLTQPVER